MSQARFAHSLITTLLRSKTRAMCPCCQETIDLSKTGLFYVGAPSPDALEARQEMAEDLREGRASLTDWRKRINQTSLTGARSVNIGFLLEKLAPVLKGFAFDKNDCRGLGEPIDFVIFEGASRRERVERIIVADVKTGSARLSERQKSIRDAVARKRLEWDTYT